MPKSLPVVKRSPPTVKAPRKPAAELLADLQAAATALAQALSELPVHPDTDHYRHAAQDSAAKCATYLKCCQPRP